MENLLKYSPPALMLAFLTGLYAWSNPGCGSSGYQALFLSIPFASSVPPGSSCDETEEPVTDYGSSYDLYSGENYSEYGEDDESMDEGM